MLGKKRGKMAMDDFDGSSDEEPEKKPKTEEAAPPKPAEVTPAKPAETPAPTPVPTPAPAKTEEPAKPAEKSSEKPATGRMATRAKSKPLAEPKPEPPKPEPKAAKTAAKGKAKEEEMTDEKPDPKSIKQVKVTNGIAPVDEYVPGKDKYIVYGTKENVYSKTMTVANCTANNNKFYIAQLLEDPKTKHYFTFFRWGRIGKAGDQKMTPHGSALPRAISEYQSKLNDKLRKGEYTEVKIVYGEEEGEAEEDQEEKMQKAIASAAVGADVAELVRSLFSIKLFTESVKTIGYDVKRMPLGKLSIQAIRDGYAALKVISEQLKKKGGNKSSTILESTNDFFRAIPHDFGFQDMRANVISTEAKVQEKVELLDTLSNIKIAKNMLEEAPADTSGKTNAIDSHYKKLGADIKGIDLASKEGEMINKYLTTTTTAQMKAGTNIKILNIFSIGKPEETSSFNNALDNKLLLMHGSRMSNFASLLSQGLQVPPPESPTTGFMFGKGIYFTDTFSRAFNQCYIHLSNDVGYLLLCEVALGQSHKMFHSDYSVTLPADKQSIMACGRVGPDVTKRETIEEKLAVPYGPIKDTGEKNTMVQFNEYIVFNKNQIKIRYLVKFKKL